MGISLEKVENEKNLQVFPEFVEHGSDMSNN